MSTSGVGHGSDLSHSGVQPTAKARSSAGASHLAVNLLIWAGSLLLAGSAVLHFHLWDSEGYRNIPTIGPLFLTQAIVGVVLALATAVLRKLVLVIASAGLAVSSIGGLLIAVWWGLFGWQESFAAPYVGSRPLDRSRGRNPAWCRWSRAGLALVGDSPIHEVQTAGTRRAQPH